MRRSTLIGLVVAMALAAVGVLGRAEAAPGDRKLLGKAGAWKGTLVGVVMKNSLYTVEQDGFLYATDLKSGKWKRVGKAKFVKPRFMLVGGSSLYAVLDDGSLYRVNPATGARQRVGKGGEWKDTKMGTAVNGQFYTIESSGTLYSTNPAKMEWKQIGKQEFGGTKFVLGRNKAGYVETGLFTIETDGSLYNVNPADGTWKVVGKEGAYKGCKAATIAGDSLYIIDANGVLQQDFLSGDGGSAMGKPQFKRTTHLFATEGANGVSLYALDADGSLYSVESAPMAG